MSITPSQTSGLRRAVRCAALPLLPLLLGGFAAAACAQQTTDASKPTEHRTFAPAPKFSPGQTDHFKTRTVLHVKYKGQELAQAASKEVMLRYKALEVKPDGSVTLSVFSEGGFSGAPGGEKPTAKDPDNSGRAVTLDKKDNILSIQDGSASGAGSMNGLLSDASMLVLFHFVPLPDRPIKNGDSWSARYPLPNASTASNDRPGDKSSLLSKMKLIGTEMVDKQETLQIEQVYTLLYESDVDDQVQATSDSKNAAGHLAVHVTYTLKVNVLPSNGQVVQSQGAVNGTMEFTGKIAKKLPSDTLEITGVMSVNHVSEADAAAAPASAAAEAAADAAADNAARQKVINKK